MILPKLEYGDKPYDGTSNKLTCKLQTLQNRCLRTCLIPKQHIPTIRMQDVCKIANLKARRKMHLQLYMFKQKNNPEIVNTRNTCTRLHDAVVFTTLKPNSKKYKINVFYKGAIAWNELSVVVRNSQTYIILKDYIRYETVS